ncbi:MAG: hypothetical protein GXY05_03070 [Clostridiales bacterium]|nr:hypothetical protein [Clostridiales bacterium]
MSDKQNTISISSHEKLVLSTIGETGLYESSDIISACLDKVKVVDFFKKDTATRRRYEYALQKLIKKGIVEKLDINNPLKHRYAAYRITPGLEEAYEKFLSEKPVPSLLSGAKDHATLEHFIGVIELEKLLLKSGNYSFVSSKRSDCRLITLSNLEYIPDVIAKYSTHGGGSGMAVFEYERNTHTQQQFEEKLNKAKGLNNIFKVQRSQINIVTNNDVNADELKARVLEWIDKTGTDRLEHVIVRISTLTRLDFNIQNDRLVNDKRSWRWIFNIQKNGKRADFNKEKITRFYTKSEP